MNIENTVLNNNLNTLFIHQEASKSATVQIWFRAGSALEDKKDEGIAHFLEHMFFKGTQTRPGSQIAHDIESYGGEVNAFTSFDYTCYYINTPNNKLDESVNILMDMVSNPEFKMEDLIPEREVVFEEYRRSIDNPSQYNFQQIQSSGFTKGYAHPILGNEKTITTFSRDQLIAFRKKYYNTQNAMLVVAGDLNKKDKLIESINKYTIPSGDHSKFPKFQLKKNSTINVHHKDVRQSVITLAIQAPKYSDIQASSQDLAINCMAHGETSTLYQNLVAKSPIASGSSGSTMYFSDGGAHFLRIAFPTENLDKVLKSFESIIVNSAKDGFEDEVIDKIKNQYIASKIYDKESLEAYAFTLGHGFAQDGNIHCEDDFIDRIKKTSSKKINSELKTIFSNPIQYTLQVPRSENLKKCRTKIESFDKSLKKKLSQIKKAQTVYKETPSKFDKTAKVIELKKGIKLIYKQNTMTPTFVFHSYLKGGLSNENKVNNGTHYLIGRSFTYGYKGFPYTKLKSELENLSANFSGFSGKNAYGLTLHGQTEHFSTLMKHFFSTLQIPTFPSKFVSLEKKLIERTIDNHKEDPIKHCFKNFNKLIFNKHHYEMELYGSLESLKKIKSKNLLDQHSKNLKSSPMVFTYCGDLDEDEVVETIMSHISKLPARAFKKTKIKQPKAILGKEIKVDFNREQTHIFIGTSAYGVFKKEDLFLKMLTAHLSGQSSELFVEVRDRQGLCYSCQPVHHAALETGYWGIYIGAGHDKKDQAIKAIKAILDKLANKGLSKSEFNRIKKMLDGQSLLNFQTNEDYANTYSIPELHDLGIDFVHENHQKINKITHTEFNAFLKKFLSSKWNTIEVGP